MNRDAENATILAAVERACQRAREVAATGSLPLETAQKLQRTERDLQIVSEERLDWPQVSAKISHFSGWWDQLARLVEVLGADEQVEQFVGFDPDVSVRAQVFWNDILNPILKHYHALRHDFSWDPKIAMHLVASWREAQNRRTHPRQALAPLHNCKPPVDPSEIEPGLTIRALTDEDRNDLWQAFGAEHFPGPINPTVQDLDAWEAVIDYRWELPRTPPLSNESAEEVVRDTVRAIRLHHPGVTGTTVIWHRPDPAELFPSNALGSSLFAPLGTGPGLFTHRLASHVGKSCAEPLQVLLNALRDVRTDKRLNLAIRRFDAAYLRLDPEDRLLDLWIAFEALLLPDVFGELSYRAAIRIAQLVGQTSEQKRSAFKLARDSYKLRSEVAHGKASKSDLSKVVEQTRELAREAIKAWLLDPKRDICSLDDAIFTSDKPSVS